MSPERLSQSGTVLAGYACRRSWSAGAERLRVHDVLSPYPGCGKAKGARVAVYCIPACRVPRRIIDDKFPRGWFRLW